MDEPNLLVLKDRVRLARSAYQHGQAPQSTLDTAADAYIAALKAYKRRTGRKLSIPSRAYIIRAV
jgi:hypothetical protein